MKLNLNLLNKFVNISKLKINDIISRLTNSGFEIEGCEPTVDSDPLIIGQVIECNKDHENEKINVCKINIEKEVLNIITTAQNINVGDKVVVATDGTNIKCINKKIVKSELYGHISEGMLIGYTEIGISKELLNEEESNGLIKLDKEAPIGGDFFNYMNLSLPILEVSITPNRIDVYNYINFAKEIAGLFNLNLLKNRFTKNIEQVFETNLNVKSISRDCNLFSLSEIRNIKINESPLWIKFLLWKNGVKSINNVVDAGNLVTLILNQPVHVFDKDKLKSNNFYVKKISNNKIDLLNNTQCQLDGDLCVVNREPLSIAGVIGGVNSSVTEITSNIVLEVASFSIKQIREEQKKLSLSTDSSIRFSRGVDALNYDEVHNLFWSILYSQNKNIKCSNIVCEKKRNHVLTRNIINVSFDFIKSYSSIKSLKLETVKRIFRLLSFDFELNNNEFEVVIPTFRKDVKIREDLIEEIVRYLGYDKVVAEFPKIEISIDKPLNKKYNFLRLIKSYLINHGFYETINYSLTSDEKAKDFNILFKPKKFWRLQNEISINRTTMRASAISGLLENISLNNNKQIKNVNVFEISKMFFDDKDELVLSIASAGIIHHSDLHKQYLNKFYVLKGIIESILSLSKISMNEVLFKNIDDNNDLHIGKSAYIWYGKKIIGYIGEVHPFKKDKYKLKNDTYVCEINLNSLYEVYLSKTIKLKEISVFPKVSRDLSIEISKDINSNDVIKYINSLNAKNLINIYLFDVYEKEDDEKFKSIAIRFEFQHLQKTLSDSEVTDEFEIIKGKIIKEFNAVIK